MSNNTKRTAAMIAGFLVVSAIAPAAALAQAGGGGGQDLTGIFSNLGDTASTIGAVVGGIMLIGCLIVAWAKQSAAAAGAAVLMAVVVAMAANGTLWKTSEKTAKGLAGGGSSLTSGK